MDSNDAANFKSLTRCLDCSWGSRRFLVVTRSWPGTSVIRMTMSLFSLDELLRAYSCLGDTADLRGTVGGFDARNIVSPIDVWSSLGSRKTFKVGVRFLQLDAVAYGEILGIPSRGLRIEECVLTDLAVKIMPESGDRRVNSAPRPTPWISPMHTS